MQDDRDCDLEFTQLPFEPSLIDRERQMDEALEQKVLQASVAHSLELQLGKCRMPPTQLNGFSSFSCSYCLIRKKSICSPFPIARGRFASLMETHNHQASFDQSVLEQNRRLAGLLWREAVETIRARFLKIRPQPQKTRMPSPLRLAGCSRQITVAN